MLPFTSMTVLKTAKHYGSPLIFSVCLDVIQGQGYGLAPVYQLSQDMEPAAKPVMVQMLSFVMRGLKSQFLSVKIALPATNKRELTNGMITDGP